MSFPFGPPPGTETRILREGYALQVQIKAAEADLLGPNREDDQADAQKDQKGVQHTERILDVEAALLFCSKRTQLHSRGNVNRFIERGIDQRDEQGNEILHSLEDITLVQLEGTGEEGLLDGVEVAEEFREELERGRQHKRNRVTDTDALQRHAKSIGESMISVTMTKYRQPVIATAIRRHCAMA